MRVIIEKQQPSEGGGFIAYNDGDENFSLIGTGATVSEAKDDFFNSIHEIEECCRDTGRDIPPELNEEVEFRFSMPSLFEAFPWINVTKLARAIGINPSLLHQYKGGNVYISDSQLARIEVGIHSLAADMLAVKLV